MPYIALIIIVVFFYGKMKPKIDAFITSKREEIFQNLIAWSGKLRLSNRLTEELEDELYEQVDALTSLEILSEDCGKFVYCLIGGAVALFMCGGFDAIGAEHLIILALFSIGIALWILAFGYYLVRINQILLQR